MQVIGLINITNYDAAHFMTYFLKEFFRYAKNSERRIPQIIIDSITDIENKSSAYTDEFQYNKIVSVLGEEIQSLLCSHSNKVAILCNVAHLYMETVLSTFSDIKPYFVDIVESAVLEAKKNFMNEVLVLCSKNAQNSKIFDKYFFRHNISVHYVINDQDTIESLMCAVENNCIDDRIVSQLYNLCSKYRNHNIYFACTELSFIYGNNRALFSDFKIIDTVDCAIHQLLEVENN